jgi:hypothetical protein
VSPWICLASSHFVCFVEAELIQILLYNKNVKKISLEILLTSAAIFIFLLGIYYFFYSGFPVSDDEQLFAAVSQSLAAGEGTQAPQLYGNYRLLGSFTGSGPLHVWLGAALLYLLPESVGQVQALYLLTPLYTALTAVLIALIITQLGGSLKTAIVTSLLFGVSTIALPYSQTTFREPLAMLLLTVTWLLLLLAIDGNSRRWQQIILWVVSFLTFICVLFTKVLLLSILPAFFYLLVNQPDRSTRKKVLLASLILFALAGLISVLAPQNRFSLEFFDRLWNLRRQFPYQEVPKAVFEMLFTPGRGLLVYTPILLLLPLAWFHATSKSRQAIIFSLLAAGGLILAQATAYGSEWWGITWSTRFLLPVLPFLIVGLAPAVEFLLGSTRRIFRFSFWGLFGVGFLIQLGGVLVSNSAYMIDLYYTQLVPDIGGILWSFRHAPLVAYWRLLFAGAEINFASARLINSSPGWVIAVTVGCLLLVGTGGVLMVRLLRGSPVVRFRRWVGGILLFGAIMLPALMLTGYREDPRYGANRTDIVQLAGVLEREVAPDDVILVFPYLRTGWNYFLNFYHGPADWYSLPNTYPAGDMASTIQLLDRLNGQYSRVWLVAETGSWEPPTTFLESYLGQIGRPDAFAVFDQVDPNLQLRLLLYSLDQPAGQ